MLMLRGSVRSLARRRGLWSEKLAASGQPFRPGAGGIAAAARVASAPEQALQLIFVFPSVTITAQNVRQRVYPTMW